MSLDPEQGEISALDVALGQALANSYGNLSRRSFLAALTRKVMSLTGVMLAGQILPMPARAQEDCGMHGHPCGTGNCQTSVTGAMQRQKWVQCCMPPGVCNGSYMRCVYIDYCRNIAQYGVFNPDGCAPPTPGGTSWCGPGAVSYSFICTYTACGDTYETLLECKQGWLTQTGAGGMCDVGGL